MGKACGIRELTRADMVACGFVSLGSFSQQIVSAVVRNLGHTAVRGAAVLASP